jgi:endonuclease G
MKFFMYKSVIRHSKTALLLVTLACLGLFVACNDDDDKLPEAKRDPVVVDGENLNANPTNVDESYGRLEFPKLKGDGSSVVLVRRVPNYGINYSLEYDRQKRSQRWVCWQWYRGNSGVAWNRSNWDREYDNNEWVRLNMRTHGFSDPFQPDPDLELSVRTELEEYENCGFQRGHICASADRRNSKEANEQTFYLSNIMPQSYGLNNGVWQTMENHVRNQWNNDAFRRVLYVVKGGTIDRDNQIRCYTSTRLLVPKYFFMALLCEDQQGGYKALGFWVEHTDREDNSTQLRQYVVSISKLEELTGIDFFCNLPDEVERQVENVTTSEIVADWGIK